MERVFSGFILGCFEVVGYIFVLFFLLYFFGFLMEVLIFYGLDNKEFRFLKVEIFGIEFSFFFMSRLYSALFGTIEKFIIFYFFFSEECFFLFFIKLRE